MKYNTRHGGQVHPEKALLAALLLTTAVLVWWL